VDEAPPEAIPHPPDAPVAPAEPEGAPETATHDQPEASVDSPADERE
jgi:hypothetical protein